MKFETHCHEGQATEEKKQNSLKDNEGRDTNANVHAGNILMTGAVAVLSQE